VASPPLDPVVAREALKAHREHASQQKAAEALGISRSTLQSRLKVAAATGIVEDEADFEIAELPDEDIATSDLIALRKRHFVTKAKAKEAKRLIPVTVKVDGPIGIAHFGDPHVDDDGTNIVALERHVNVVKATDGMFAGNAGDTTNNWIGRLARLYGEQGTSAKQGWQLAEWLFGSMRWMYAIGGNHDCWSGSGDPLKWIARQSGVLYHPHGVRLELALPSGRTVLVNARHTWRGNSQWNAAHGVSKAVQLGHRDHLVTAGHIHVSGYQVHRDPSTRRISHAIQIASYKTYDRYAEAEGFPDQNIFVCPVTIIDPAYPDTDPRFITTVFDPEEGASYLTWKRKRAGVHGGRRGTTRTA
jgi:hypothetical protein